MESTTHCHFHITGEFITKQARSFWNAEDKEEYAIKFLLESLPGLTEAQAIEICTGKAKLTGENNEVFLEQDNSTHDQYGNKLRSVAETISKQKRMIQDANDDYSIATRTSTSSIASPWGLITVPNHIANKLKDGEIDWDAPFFNRYSRCPKEYLPPQNIYAESNSRNDNELLDSPPPLPDPDSTLSSLNGWINPKGQFFPCIYGKHEELAYHLGSSSKDLENEGWIKIQDSKDGWGEIGLNDCDVIWDEDKEVTQAQIDTVFNWCQKHHRPMPKELLKD